jgi:hypothetical protein
MKRTQKATVKQPDRLQAPKPLSSLNLSKARTSRQLPRKVERSTELSGVDIAIETKLAVGYYVYTISVAGVIRYIGKGKGQRLYSHMKEVRSRLKRDFRIQSIGSILQRNLTKAFLSGAKVIEQILIDDLTETAAYKLEYDKLRDYVFACKRDQLWNVIPASIQTPQEIQAYTERLQRNLNSRNRWVRNLSAMTLKALRRGLPNSTSAGLDRTENAFSRSARRTAQATSARVVQRRRVS